MLLIPLEQSKVITAVSSLLDPACFCSVQCHSPAPSLLRHILILSFRISVYHFNLHTSCIFHSEQLQVRGKLCTLHGLILGQSMRAVRFDSIIQLNNSLSSTHTHTHTHKPTNTRAWVNRKIHRGAVSFVPPPVSPQPPIYVIFHVEFHQNRDSGNGCCFIYVNL
jgi:hypothetical protein